LQIGALGGPGEGTYTNYQGSSIGPTEDDTAITSGSTLYVAGTYGSKTLWLGGQFPGDSTYPEGENWSNFGYDPIFNNYAAILLAAIPDGTLASANLTINGASPFFSSTTIGGFFPNKHDPLKDLVADFLFYDIGNFANNSSVVPNFVDETGAANGEIKTLTLAGTDDLAWIHFDALALETTKNGGKIKTSVANNPGSHDVTWKNERGGDPEEVPEPGILLLFGTGLLGVRFAGHHRRKHKA
jgi:hypothetical protein